MIKIPQIQSAKKRMRQNARRHERNQVRRDARKQTLKKMRRAITSGDKSTAESLMPQLMKVADKAAKHNVIHANKAARLKSRLVKKIQAIG